MKDIRIDGKMQRVFVLKEKDNRTVYIPVKSLHRRDYERLKELEQRGGELMKEMQKTILDNGRNALELYDDLIQVVTVSGSAGDRLRKPDEAALAEAAPQSEPAVETTESETETQEKPKRGRGRPPKAKTE